MSTTKSGQQSAAKPAGKAAAQRQHAKSKEAKDVEQQSKWLAELTANYEQYKVMMAVYENLMAAGVPLPQLLQGPAAQAAAEPAEEEGEPVEPTEEEADDQEAEEQGEQEAEVPTEATKRDAVQPAAGATTKSPWSEADEKNFAAIGENLRTGNAARKAGDRTHLKSWHGIGEILNGYLGHKDRHPYGLNVVDEAARRCKISADVLHRAAKFHRLQPDFDAFCAANPKLNTWSAVKAWLPGEGSGDTEEQVKRKNHQALVARVQGGLKKLRESLVAGLKAIITEGDLRDLIEDLKQTTEQVLIFASSNKPTSDEPTEEPAT